MYPSASLPHPLIKAAVLSGALLLAACGGSSSGSDANEDEVQLPAMTGGGSPETKTRLDQIIVADDGEDIGFTVFVPDNPNGAAAPLILHSHGFGLSRSRDFESSNPADDIVNGDVSGEVARRAWLDEGFYVISFDQRGFGESSGDITVMDPALDCRNVSRIIDWAEDNLANLGFREADPVIGSVGLSYGGGFQTVCSSVDQRFDAIVPLATWSHLPYSLNPNGTPKNIWLDFLVVASQGKLAPYLIEAFIEATTTGDINQAALDRLAGHSPRSFCQGEMGRSLSTADALFIQGSHDVLFNINEAVENHECWKADGRDSHLFIQRDGHILPLLQTAGEQVLFGTDRTLYCGDQQFDTSTVALDFLRSKLLGSPAATALPEVCFSLAEQQAGLIVDEVPRGGFSLTLPATTVIPGGLSTLVNLLNNLPLQTLLTTLQELPPEALLLVEDVLAGLADPAALATYADDIVNLLPAELLQQLTAPAQFIALQTLDEPLTLAGIPLAALNISGGNSDDNTLYIGLGRVPAAGGDPQLINDQVLPINGTGSHMQEMIGVSTQLDSGDTLGLMVYGFHPYFLNGAALTQPPNAAELSGSIDLPAP